MPRLVEHSEKRRDIIQATWRLIAARGFEAATMREIALEAGHANGALSHYFRNKDELLEAAFLFVWEATNERIAERLGEAKGLAAVRVYCQEVAPSTDVTLLEARIVLPFFPRAINNERLAQITADSLQRWREELDAHLQEARDVGEVATERSNKLVIDQMMSMLIGLQTLAVLMPDVHDGPAQLAQLDAFLDGLAG